METIGQRIRSLRKGKGLTQVQLAHALKIDQSTLSDMENGAGFSAEILMGLVRALGASPDNIMSGKDVTDDLFLSDEERDMVLAFRDRRAQREGGGHTLVKKAQNERALPDSGVRVGRNLAARFGPKRATPKKVG